MSIHPSGRIAEVDPSKQLAIDLAKGKEAYFTARDEFIREYKETGRRKEIQSALKAMQKDGGPRIWINTLWDSLCAGHTDERGFKGDPDGSWGWALENGATMIQTDRPDELIKYLESKGRRNL